MHKNIRLLKWFNFMNDFRVYGPIMILYFAQVSGSYALGMSVFSVTNLASSAFEVPTGVLSDRIGRKYTLVAGALASVLSIVCYAIGGTYAALVIGGILEGLARAFFSGNNDALLHDTLTEIGQVAQYQEYLGKISSMFQIALAVSAVLGGLIAAASFALTFWISVIPQVCGLMIALQIVEPHVHSRHISLTIYGHLREAFVNIIRNPRLRNLTAAGIVNWAVGESGWLFRSAFISMLWPTWALGLSQLVANVGAAISFYFAGRLIKRFGEFRILMTEVLFSRLSVTLSLAFPTVLSPLLMSSSSFLFGAGHVAANGLEQHEFTPAQRATMASMTTFAGSIAFALFSFFLGALADRIGVIPAFLVAQVLGLPSAYFYWRVFRVANTPSPQSV
jgi:MFS family permease